MKPLLLLLLCTSACAGGYCGADSDVDPESAGPFIDDMKLLTDVVPGDPWEVVFVADFRAPRGDLAAGLARFFLNGSSEATEIALFDVFRQSALDADAKKGSLAIPLRFADTVPDGANVRVGLQLDAARDVVLHTELGPVSVTLLRPSNCYGLDLDFSVE